MIMGSLRRLFLALHHAPLEELERRLSVLESRVTKNSMGTGTRSKKIEEDLADLTSRVNEWVGIEGYSNDRS